MSHVNLDTQPEAVRHFVLALSASPEGAVLESAGRPVLCVVPPPHPLDGPGTQEGEPNGGRSGPEADPVADFYDAVQWGWAEAGYKVRQALKRYSDATDADHPDATD